LEVNLADIEAIAAGLDAQADEAVTIGKRTPKKRVARAKNPTNTVSTDTTAQTVEPEVVAPLDPEFEAMLTFGASQGIDLMKDKLELMEPGNTVRDGVGKCLARIIGRLKPMQPGPVSDVVQIVGYLGVWVIVGRDWSAKPPTVTVIPPNN
jgi:hypothetical protein